jgi:UDPglucose 6-dehydrogenase
MRQIYQPVVEGAFKCPCHGQPAAHCCWKKPELLLTNVHSAELIKHAANSFLSLKISYANAIADLCELAGANADEVLRGIGLDHRIGREFLRPGIGFGGFCFPKDLSAFIQMAGDLGYDFRLLREVQAINQARPEQFIRKVREELWVVQDKTVGVLGLAFKAGTDDTRLSPAYPIIRELVRLGARIQAYDPKAMDRARSELPEGIDFCESAEAVAQGAEMILILTEWTEFRQANWEAMGQAMSRRLVLDGRNLFAPGDLARFGFEYYSIGRSSERAEDQVTRASS